MKKDDKLHLIKGDVKNRKKIIEIKEKILSELDVDRTSTHTTESPLFETLASLTITKASNQG